MGWPWLTILTLGALVGSTDAQTRHRPPARQATTALKTEAAALTCPHVLGQGVGVHQTALYDFVSASILLLFLLIVMNRKPRREGVLILTWAIWYGSTRIITDFLRVDKRFFGLTGSQWTSIAVASASAITLVVWAIRPRPGPKPIPVGATAPPGASVETDDEPTTVFTPPREPGGDG